jgi:phage terminase small subunit
MTPMPTPPGVKPPETEDESNRLNKNEITYILDTTLFPEHRDDPNVLKFIDSYLRSRNERQASIEAGLDPKVGRVLKSRSDIWRCIKALTDKAALKFGLDAHSVVESFKESAFFDIADCVDEDGKWLQLNKIPPEARRNIKKIKYKNFFEDDPNGMKVWKGEIIECEFYDKQRAGELIGREVDLFKEKKVLERDIGQNMRDVLLDASKRAEAKFEEARGVMLIEGRKVVGDESEKK